MLQGWQTDTPQKIQGIWKEGRRGLMGVALLLAAGTAGYVVWQTQSVPDTPEVPAQVAPQIRTVTALGRLEPAGEVIEVSAPAAGERSNRIEKLLVAEGDRVAVGQVIAVLDSEARLKAALQQAQAEVQTAEARLAQVRAGAKQGEIAAQAARFEQQQAELTGQIATQRATIARLEAELQGERQAQQAAIDRFAAEARQARTDCDRYESLFRSGAVAEQERDQACLTAETAQERLEEARANLNRIVSSRQEQIREARANLERTIATQEQQIAVAQTTLEAIAEVRPVDVDIAVSELSAARAAVARAQADLDQASVKSPQAGQILEVLARPGELVGNEGIVEIGQTQQMYAIAEVYESDIPKVQVGQPVTVTSDALGSELHGMVTKVGLQVLQQDVVNTDATADVDARIVEVKVRLDEESSRKVAGLTNLQVTAQIQVAPAGET